MAPVTASFAVLILSLLTVLAMNTTRHRFRAGRNLDAEKKEAIRRASRAHGNLLEHGVPVLLMMFFYEMNGGSVRALCVVGTIFLLVRLSYAYGVLTKPGSKPMVFGAGVTYLIEVVLLGLLASVLL